MTPPRIVLKLVGLALFVLVADLDWTMAGAADSIRALSVMWLLVPAPAVFLLLSFWPPRLPLLRRAGSAYLGLSVAATGLVLLGVAWTGSQRALHPRLCEDLPQLADYPQLQARLEDVHFQSRDGTALAGWFIPGDSRATVLLLHGYRCKRDEMLLHADMLHRAGYSVLLFDFRNRGDSGGDAVTLGYLERGDVLGAIDYLKTRPDVDPRGYGVLGISQGGATAILAAAQSQDIRAVAAEGAFRSLNSVIGQSFEHFIGLPAFPFAPLTVWMSELRVGIRSEDIVPEHEVKAIAPRPVFIMHGELDTTISPEDGEAIFAAAQEPKQWWLIPGAAHGEGAEKAAAEYERRIVAFFDAYIR